MILSLQAFSDRKEEKMFPGGLQTSQENPATGDDPILPHDRVGSDFSWLQGSVQRKDAVFEAEESFLYEDTRKAPPKSFPETFCRENHSRAQEASGIFDLQQQRHNDTVRSFDQLFDVQQHLQSTSRMASALLDSSQCEKIRSILQCLDMEKGQEPAEGRRGQAPLTAEAPPAITEPDLLQALETSFIKGELQAGPPPGSRDLLHQR